MICNGQSAKQLIDYGDATLADSDGIDDGHLLFNKNYNYPCKIILVGGKGYAGFTLTPSAGQSQFGKLRFRRAAMQHCQICRSFTLGAVGAQKESQGRASFSRAQMKMLPSRYLADGKIVAACFIAY